MRSRKLLRRLITQIFAGRCRIIVIRRELPRTICAGWSIDLPHNAVEDSPSRGLQDRNLYHLHCDFLPCRYLPYAAWPSAFLCSASTLTPMAQMNPNSSRPTAVITFPVRSAFDSGRVNDAAPSRRFLLLLHSLAPAVFASMGLLPARGGRPRQPPRSCDAGAHCRSW